MPAAAIVWNPALAAYELSPSHPLKPVRVVLAVALMRAYGLLAEDGASGSFGLGGPGAALATATRAEVLTPRPATDAELRLIHYPDYIAAVKRASADAAGFIPEHGLGTADDPVFRRMHEASALIAGGAIVGLDAVLDGRVERSFNIAGGLHHAQADRASGFCVYNDPAIAIAHALRERPGLRVAYLDIDAHHGDGVEAAFYDTDRVLTLSVHESGDYLFPGTGFTTDIGVDAGHGFALDVPLPPLANDACYALVLDSVIGPALRAYRPDVVVAQCGADAHHDDPLTHLGLTLPGYRALTSGIFALAEEVADGRIAACGGGGYGAYRVVPRAWTLVMAELLGVELEERLPESWREQAHAAESRDPGESALGRPAPHAEMPHGLTEDAFELSPPRAAKVLAETEAVVQRLRRSHPLLAEA